MIFVLTSSRSPNEPLPRCVGVLGGAGTQTPRPVVDPFTHCLRFHDSCDISEDEKSEAGIGEASNRPIKVLTVMVPCELLGLALHVEWPEELRSSSY